MLGISTNCSSCGGGIGGSSEAMGRDDVSPLDFLLVLNFSAATLGLLCLGGMVKQWVRLFVEQVVCT